MTRILFKFVGVVILLNFSQVCCLSQPLDKWQYAEMAIKRLSPVAFPQLPKAIIKSLQKRGCRIPQADDFPEPHNVIRGQFANPKQNDWAVLCSRKHKSSILIFWNASTTSVSELATSPDLGWMQGTGENRIGYSRAIAPANKKDILDHFKSYGGAKPPPINHFGINDAFVGKASSIHYLYRGKWLQLQGAD